MTDVSTFSLDRLLFSFVSMHDDTPRYICHTRAGVARTLRSRSHVPRAYSKASAPIYATMIGTMTNPTTCRVPCGHTHARRSAGRITARPRNASRDHHRGVSVKTGASTGLYDDETFATSVLRKYPTSHEPADTEEARVLWEHGYVALDVRASSEIDFEGKVSLF